VHQGEAILRHEISTTDRIDSVQLLRGVAALAVVTDHFRLFGNGAWGVDIFFVISGFIMCYITQKSGHHFFSKRIIRVVPLYWLGTMGVFCVALLFPSLLNSTKADLVELAKSLLFIPFQKGQYIQPVLFLGWTLNYEMFFYLLFAVSMAISRSYRWVICSTVLILLTIAGKLFSFENPILKFYTSSILIEFVLGMLAYQIYSLRIKHWTTSEGRSTWLYALSAIVAIGSLAALPLLEEMSRITGRAVAWGIPAFVFFLASIRYLSGRQLPKASLLIGDASYSLYLFHPYIIQVFAKFFKSLDSPSIQGYFITVCVIALCCCAAVFIYYFIERPLTSFLRSVFLAKQLPGTAQQSVASADPASASLPQSHR
jgi:peptidoglycan/LPS O-acetylase OafA/YrhL